MNSPNKMQLEEIPEERKTYLRKKAAERSRQRKRLAMIEKRKSQLGYI